MFPRADDNLASLMSAVEMQRRKNKRRRIKAPLYPLGQEREYRKELVDIVKFIRLLITYRLFPKILPMKEEAEKVIRSDSFMDDLNDIIGGIRFSVFSRYPANRRQQLAMRSAGIINSFNKRQFETNVLVANNLPIPVVEPWIEPYLESYSYVNSRLIESISDRYLDNVQSIINEGVLNGIKTSEIREQIQSQFGVSERRAQLIARDQVSKLNGQLNRTRQEKAGFDKYTWQTAGDDAVRESHRAKQGNVYSWDKAPSDTGHPGEDYNCLVSGTRVEFPNHVFRGFKRKYVGSIVEISCESGVSISVTPNHPILTTVGWVFAKDLNSSHKLLQSLRPDVSVALGTKVDDSSASCNNVFDFFKVGGSNKRVTGTDVQFHGDGVVDEEVEIVGPPSGLSEDGFKDWLKEFKNSLFPDPNLSKAPLSRGSHLPEFSHVSLSSFGRLMSFGGLVGPLGRSHAFPFHCLSLGLASDLYSHFNQPCPDDSPSGFKSFRDFILTDSAFVKLLYLKDVEVFSIPGHLLFSSAIKEINHTSYTGDVYNFETQDNYYLGNHLVVSNCRCWAEPYFEDDE